MTPLLGTKTPSALVGAKSGGDRRAARSLLSSALWSGKGGYGAAWAASVSRTGNTPCKVFTNHEARITQHGFSLSLRRLQGEQPQAQPTGFSRITRHETRITAFMLPYSPFPTISRYFLALFGPPHPQPIKGSPAVHRSGPVSYTHLTLPTKRIG